MDTAHLIVAAIMATGLPACVVTYVHTARHAAQWAHERDEREAARQADDDTTDQA